MTLYRAMVALGAVCPEDGRRKYTPEQMANIKAQDDELKQV